MKENPTIIHVDYEVNTVEGFDGRPCIVFLPEDTPKSKIESLVKKDAAAKYPKNKGFRIRNVVTRKQYL